MTCIATFYSHFGAIRFKKTCDSLGWTAQVMPVPRNLSSSCGTCVRYEGECPDSRRRKSSRSCKSFPGDTKRSIAPKTPEVITWKPKSN